jgi:hypothetical protein
MIRILTRTCALAAGLLLAAPPGAAAQSTIGSDGWWDWAVPVVEGRGQQARQGQGPPFCRGNRPQGHPVHGREWCRAKGWTANWNRTRWDDAVLRLPDRRRSGVYEQDTLSDILGRVIYGRVDGQRRQLGAAGPLQGRWIDGRGGARVLQIRAGGIPIAELSDLNGNGRADVVLLNRP